MFMSMFLENIIVSIPIALLQYTQELEYIFLPDVFTKTLYFWQFKLVHLDGVHLIFLQFILRH